jgi:hypothetical protein
MNFPSMTAGSPLEEIAGLLGGRSRDDDEFADGLKAWTGRELADAAKCHAGDRQRASASTRRHFMIDVVAHGRKHYRISRPKIARALEILMTIVPVRIPRHWRTIDETLRYLRACYDALAGKLAVALCDTLIARDCAD